MEEFFENVWQKLIIKAGNKFFTKTKEPFSYKIVNDCFIPLRPNKAPKVSKEYVKIAYEQWPVKGPGFFSENILASSYLWGVFNGVRIIKKEE